MMIEEFHMFVFSPFLHVASYATTTNTRTLVCSFSLSTLFETHSLAFFWFFERGHAGGKVRRVGRDFSPDRSKADNKHTHKQNRVLYVRCAKH